MALFGLFKSKDHLIEYRPGGRVLPVRLTIDKNTKEVHYYGAFGSHANFFIKDVDYIDCKRMNDRQGVVIVQGVERCLGTFDILPVEVCQNIISWLTSRENEVERIAVNPGNQGVSEYESNPYEALRHIKQLFDEGILTEDEYVAKKKEYVDKL